MNKKLKIAVYTITKNEEKFIKRYCDSAKEADEVYIFDTGSTDSTIDIAKNCGAIIHKIHVSPWRFDVARNASLAMISSNVDICIALDADEILMPGWRDEVESLWKAETTRMQYIFDWSSNLIFFSNKIHSRNGYFWKYACHEMITLDPRVKESFVFTDKLLVKHLPDPTKSRSQYLDLLEVTVKENPTEPRHAFFYARELIFYNKFDQAIIELKKYLNMPNALWLDERSYAMRLLGNIYKRLNNMEESLKWFIKATEEAPHRKEPWYILAQECYERKLWDQSYNAAKKCIAASPSVQWPVDGKVNTGLPYDYAAIAAYCLGKKEEAIELGKKALQFHPNDERMLNNMKHYLKI